MENPATWGKAERVVNDALRTHYRQVAADEAAGEFHAGLSLPRKITDALREAGFDLKED